MGQSEAPASGDHVKPYGVHGLCQMRYRVKALGSLWMFGLGCMVYAKSKSYTLQRYPCLDFGTERQKRIPGNPVGGLMLTVKLAERFAGTLMLVTLKVAFGSATTFICTIQGYGLSDTDRSQRRFEPSWEGGRKVGHEVDRVTFKVMSPGRPKRLSLEYIAMFAPARDYILH